MDGKPMPKLTYNLQPLHKKNPRTAARGFVH